MRAGPRTSPAPGASARREAAGAFGDDRLYLEKFLDRPRHVEIQVFCDDHGNAIWLGERECSVQRRQQKVIEESPSCLLDEPLRQAMGEVAVRAARAVDYRGRRHGRVPARRRQRNFYFLEMNTRLQVEHPVTEMITGLDLVRMQLEVAQGLPILPQAQVVRRGHAIEARLYAEDAARGFLPSPGTITYLRLPGGPGLRDDSGVYAGWTVSPFYDPLLSKLVAWAPTREQAIARLIRALGDYRGPRHHHQRGLAGGGPRPPGLPLRRLRHRLLRPLRQGAAAGAGPGPGGGGAGRRRHRGPPARPGAGRGLRGPRRGGAGRRVGLDPARPRLGAAGRAVMSRYVALLDGGKREVAVDVEEAGPGRYRVRIGGRELDVDAFRPDRRQPLAHRRHRQPRPSPSTSGAPRCGSGCGAPSSRMEILPERRLRMRRALGTLTVEGRQPLVAPLPGRVLKVLVKQGDPVTRGQPLLVLEALRMENELRSPGDGTVTELRVEAGQDVASGATLLAVEQARNTRHGGPRTPWLTIASRAASRRSAG